MPKVTFTNNVYPYVKGDTVELTKAEMADVDAYVKKWKIKDAYEVEGGSKSSTPKSNAPSSTSAKTQPKAKGGAKAKSGSNSTDDKKPQTGKSQSTGNEKGDETDPAQELPEDEGNGANDES